MGSRRHHHLFVAVLIPNRVGRSGSLRPPFFVSMSRLASLVAFVGVCAACSVSGPPTTGLPDATSDYAEVTVTEMTPAVFTAEQADRGEGIFSEVC